jgi:hypothetical protein
MREKKYFEELDEILRGSNGFDKSNNNKYR